MQKVWNWLVLSSANPGELSLTIKSALMGAVTLFTVALGFAHVTVGNLTPLVDGLISVVQAFFAFFSGLMLVWGMIRKVYYTVVGQHASL